MQDRYPPTNLQIRETMEDLRAMKGQSEAIYRLIAGRYGDADQRAIRAGEVSATIQRLIWELERSTVLAATA